MTITGIHLGGIQLPQPDGPKPGKGAVVGSSPRKDRLEVSPEGSKRDGTTGGIGALAGAHPEVREDRVQEVRERVDSGYYDREDVTDTLVDKLVDKVRSKP